MHMPLIKLYLIQIEFATQIYFCADVFTMKLFRTSEIKASKQARHWFVTVSRQLPLVLSHQCWPPCRCPTHLSLQSCQPQSVPLPHHDFVLPKDCFYESSNCGTMKQSKLVKWINPQKNYFFLIHGTYLPQTKLPIKCTDI